MGIFSFLKPIVEPVLGLVGDHFEGKRKIKQAQVESEIAILHKRVDHQINWENQAITNSQSSWKDEYFVIILTAPIVMCFVPWTAPYAAQGFTVLQEIAPEWLVTLLGVMVLSSFGLKPQVKGNILTSMTNWKRKAKPSQDEPETK